MPDSSTRTPILILITALNQRGIRGPECRGLLRRYAQRRIAQHIDYYDFEVSTRAALPRWAAAPWLRHRIRRNLPPPPDYRPPPYGLMRELRLD
jgi:hypothetical protein